MHISIDRVIEGQGKQAALIATGYMELCKNIVVVDADVAPFNEE